MTVIQMTDILMDWFSKHKQIQTVLNLDDYEFEAERDVTYPVANVEYISSGVSDKMNNRTFLIKLGDLAGSDARVQNEVISDMEQIADDFTSFCQDREGWVFRKNTTFDPFKDGGGDRVSGVTFSVVLGTVRPQNNCATPA